MMGRASLDILKTLLSLQYCLDCTKGARLSMLKQSCLKRHVLCPEKSAWPDFQVEHALAK